MMRRVTDSLRSPRSRAAWWLAGARIPPEWRARHRAVVALRVAQAARVLALLTLAWIPIDLWRLGFGHVLLSLPLRVATALLLWALARAAPRLPATAAVLASMWLQAVAFAALQLAVDPTHVAALQIGYGLFPFVLAAQLALFPLSWWRILVAALAPATQLAVVLAAQPPGPTQAWSEAWLFVLIVAIAAWTGQAQLHLLVDLLGARRDAFHDPLTGLANRRAAGERLEAARAHALRHGEPLSVLMLDIDHFKRVNDVHGHADGDRVLVALADALREELRAGDLGARHGGEEFLAVLPASGASQAREAAERVRAHVQALRIPLADGPLSITISIGVATLHADESCAALLARADAALYRAKEGGRNRCVAAPPPIDGDTVPATTADRSDA